VAQQAQKHRMRIAHRKPALRIQRTVWGAVSMLALIGVAVVLRRTITLLPILINGYHPPAAAANPIAAQFAALDDVFARYPVLTLIHILPGLLFMVLGPVQFSATLRARHLRWHRWSGRVYLICSLIIGVSALAMSVAMPSIGGVTQAAATTLFALLFLFALGKAYWHVLHQEIAQHREWMLRAFAVGLAVATIRPIIGLFFATSRFSGLTPNAFFGIAFWIGFVLHLLVAETWIRWTRPMRRAAAVPAASRLE
jgi:Predicted membrane protein (DUF2306)